jgi:hypothetical protein
LILPTHSHCSVYSHQSLSLPLTLSEQPSYSSLIPLFDPSYLLSLSLCHPYRPLLSPDKLLTRLLWTIGENTALSFLSCSTVHPNPSVHYCTSCPTSAPLPLHSTVLISLTLLLPLLRTLLSSPPFYSADNVQFEKDLMDIARTTLSSKLLNVEKDHFARYTTHYTAHNMRRQVTWGT